MYHDEANGQQKWKNPTHDYMWLKIKHPDLETLRKILMNSHVTYTYNQTYLVFNIMQSLLSVSCRTSPGMKYLKQMYICFKTFMLGMYTDASYL